MEPSRQWMVKECGGGVIKPSQKLGSQQSWHGIALYVCLHGLHNRENFPRDRELRAIRERTNEPAAASVKRSGPDRTRPEYLFIRSIPPHNHSLPGYIRSFVPSFISHDHQSASQLLPPSTAQSLAHSLALTAESAWMGASGWVGVCMRARSSCVCG